MTELFIGGHKVVLPPDLSLKFTEENPFFTKRGKFTLDLAISLLHPINARIFEHCDRINRSGDVPTGRSAVLLVDGRVVLKGTEVYLDHSNTEVQIQLVSGNSELNYVIGGDRNIRDLALGSAVLDPWPPLSETQSALDPSVLDLDESYPDRDWQLLPFMTNESDYLIGNSFYYMSLAADVTPKGNDVLKFCGVHDIRPNPYVVVRNRRPQPYFCAIIDKAFLALGYELIENVIASHDLYKYLYIVHGYDTVEFAKMLPNWTVADFLQQVEQFFDCTVIVDSDQKQVRILSNSYPIDQEEKVTLIVTDTFKAEPNEDGDFSHEDKNIGYSLDSGDYYSLSKLSAAIKKIAVKVGTTIGEIPSLISDNDDEDRFKKIFRDNETDTDFIAYLTGGSVIPKRVDCFRDLLNNPDKADGLDIEMKIIPAPFKTLVRTTDVLYYGGSLKNYHMQYPIVENYDPLVLQRPSDNNDDFSLQGLISGNDSIAAATTLNEKLRVALFMGRDYVDTVGVPNLEIRAKIEPFPICFVEDYPEYYNASTSSRQFLTGQHPFRFDWIYQNIYHKSVIVNTKNPHRLEVHSQWPFDITAQFIINNKLFLCSKVEVEIDINGVKSLPVGYFYPVEQN